MEHYTAEELEQKTSDEINQLQIDCLDKERREMLAKVSWQF